MLTGFFRIVVGIVSNSVWAGCRGVPFARDARMLALFVASDADEGRNVTPDPGGIRRSSTLSATFCAAALDTLANTTRTRPNFRIFRTSGGFALHASRRGGDMAVSVSTRGTDQ